MYKFILRLLLFCARVASFFYGCDESNKNSPSKDSPRARKEKLVNVSILFFVCCFFFVAALFEYHFISLLPCLLIQPPFIPIVSPQLPTFTPREREKKAILFLIFVNIFCFGVVFLRCRFYVSWQTQTDLHSFCHWHVSVKRVAAVAATQQHKKPPHNTEQTTQQHNAQKNKICKSIFG